MAAVEQKVEVLITEALRLKEQLDAEQAARDAAEASGVHACGDGCMRVVMHRPLGCMRVVMHRLWGACVW